jgi:hypothetical protein
MKYGLSELQITILLHIHKANLKSPSVFLGSEQFTDLLDVANTHQILLELTNRGLITHDEPIIGASQAIWRIAGIRITHHGAAVANALSPYIKED